MSPPSDDDPAEYFSAQERRIWLLSAVIVIICECVHRFCEYRAHPDVSDGSTAFDEYRDQCRILEDLVSVLAGPGGGESPDGGLTDTFRRNGCRKDCERRSILRASSDAGGRSRSILHVRIGC
jgi:hypothetical protein